MIPKKFILLFLGLLSILFLIFTTLLFKNKEEIKNQEKKIQNEFFEQPSFQNKETSDLNDAQKILSDDYLLKKEDDETNKIIKSEPTIKQKEKQIESFIKKEKNIEFKNKDKNICKSRIGKTFMVDDDGHFCEAGDKNMKSNCCKNKEKRYYCKYCSSTFNCCSIYESCVSCCLNPIYKTLTNNVIKIKKESILFKRINNLFDFCSMRCRTSSKSVINENKYISNVLFW
eukprot:gene11489-4653_t